MTRRHSPYVSSALVILLFSSILAPSSGQAADGRAVRPEDRYAMAGGCYSVEALGTGKKVGRAPGTFNLVGDPEPFHFQATDLGSYLLFGSQSDFLAVSESRVVDAVKTVDGALPGQVRALGTDTVIDAVEGSPIATASGRGEAIVAAPAASELADWEIDQVGPGAFTFYLPATDQSLVVFQGLLALVSGKAAGEDARFGFELTSGCAAWPEIEVNVTGTPEASSHATDEVRGYVDAHLHGMAYEFLGGRVRCGRPWHPYGVTAALVDCPDHGTNGETAILEQFLSGEDPGTGHSPEGWPSFAGWPRPESLTHEQVYFKWLERAWRGGLRLATYLLVENHALCAVYPYKKNSCNEMDSVRLQAKRIHEFERYIDAQSGGPGEGWFRIVTDPFQAREIIAQGKLAVIMGIEVSSPFDCFIKREIPQCDESQIDRQVDEVFDLGVRQMELTNKFDNALTGVTGDGGPVGVIINGANFAETGQFWRMGMCPESMGHSDDHAQYNAHDLGAPDELTGRDSIFAAVAEVAGTAGVAPLYPPGPHCNAMGLTKLGEYALHALMKRGMVFDPDHMSARARLQAMKIVHDEGYSGAVSSHSWADEEIYRQVYEVGATVAPKANSTQAFLNTWKKRRAQADPRYYFGLGYGSDVNGFSAQQPARHPGGADRVTYPFVGLGGVVIDKQHSGTRVYDVNDDGVAHYGLFPDWIEDLRILAESQHPGDGARIMADLARGAEAYLQMWERAVGVPGDACRDDVADLTAREFKSVARGTSWIEALETLGQPKSRHNGEFSYCLTKSRTGVIKFDANGSVKSRSIGS